MQLLDLESSTHGLKRRRGLSTKIEALLSQEWRSIDVVVAEREDRLAGGEEN
jgi:hypothetical protein